MTLRSIMSLLLGGWLMGTLLIGFVAAENFWIIDRLLATSMNPEFHKTVGTLAVGEARALLRYLASEQNRFFFVGWGWTEAVLGAALLVMALRLASGRVLLGLAGMFAIVLVTQFFLTPRIVSIGRALDFVPREPAPPQLRTFGLLHAAYTVLDIVKLLIGFGVAWVLACPSKPATPPAAAPAKISRAA